MGWVLGLQSCSLVTTLNSHPIPRVSLVLQKALNFWSCLFSVAAHLFKLSQCPNQKLLLSSPMIPQVLCFYYVHIRNRTGSKSYPRSQHLSPYTDYLLVCPALGGFEAVPQQTLSSVRDGQTFTSGYPHRYRSVEPGQWNITQPYERLKQGLPWWSSG